MAQTNLIESDIATTCDRCGDECSEGYEERGIGRRDPETGYKDYEIVCRKCNAEERGLCESCLREEATHTVGDQRLCATCADEAMRPDSDMEEF